MLPHVPDVKICSCPEELIIFMRSDTIFLKYPSEFEHHLLLETCLFEDVRNSRLQLPREVYSLKLALLHRFEHWEVSRLY
jgi:hypothetical protein